jgi:hypothetical protein
MFEPERTFTIYYFSEVSAEITLIHSKGLVGSGNILAKAHHPSGTGMQNWYHFTDNEVPHYQNAEHVRASANIEECENERDAILTCLARMADKLWPGLSDWRAESVDDFDKDTFYKDMLQAFIVGEWTVEYGRVSEDALPPKALSERSPND